MGFSLQCFGTNLGGGRGKMLPVIHTLHTHPICNGVCNGCARGPCYITPYFGAHPYKDIRNLQMMMISRNPRSWPSEPHLGSLSACYRVGPYTSLSTTALSQLCAVVHHEPFIALNAETRSRLQLPCRRALAARSRL